MLMSGTIVWVTYFLPQGKWIFKNYMTVGKALRSSSIWDVARLSSSIRLKARSWPKLWYPTHISDTPPKKNHLSKHLFISRHFYLRMFQIKSIFKVFHLFSTWFKSVPLRPTQPSPPKKENPIIFSLDNLFRIRRCSFHTDVPTHFSSFASVPWNGESRT